MPYQLHRVKTWHTSAQPQSLADARSIRRHDVIRGGWKMKCFEDDDDDIDDDNDDDDNDEDDDGALWIPLTGLKSIWVLKSDSCVT